MGYLDYLWYKIRYFFWMCFFLVFHLYKHWYTTGQEWYVIYLIPNQHRSTQVQWNMGPIHSTCHSFCNDFHRNSLQWIHNWICEQQLDQLSEVGPMLLTKWATVYLDTNVLLLSCEMSILLFSLEWRCCETAIRNVPMFCCSHEALKYIRVGKVKNTKQLLRFTSVGVLCCCWPRLLLPYPVKPQ